MVEKPFLQKLSIHITIICGTTVEIQENISIEHESLQRGLYDQCTYCRERWGH